MKIAQNIKTGKEYFILMETAINATNEQDGQEMVIYQSMDNQIFTREKEEFLEKFRIKNHQNFTVKSMLRAVLVKQGYDGLFTVNNKNYDCVCGCDLNDLMYCDEYSGDCKPGYKSQARNADENYYISGNKSNG
jgi:hypothetical protein